MIGVSRKFNPVDLNPEYYVDFGVSQTYRISDWSSRINKGSNNTFNTSDYKYYLDFPSITTQNFLAGSAQADNTQFDFSVFMSMEFLGALKTQPLFGNGNSGSIDEYRFVYNNSSNKLEFVITEFGVGSETADCSFSPSLSTLYNIVVTYDGTDLDIYVNGVYQSVTYTNKTNFNNRMANSTFNIGFGIGFINGNPAFRKMRGALYACGTFNNKLNTNQIDILQNKYN